MGPPGPSHVNNIELPKCWRRIFNSYISLNYDPTLKVINRRQVLVFKG